MTLIFSFWNTGFSLPYSEWGEGAKNPPPPYQFVPCNFYEVGISPQNFLVFSFKPFALLVQNVNFVPGVNAKFLNLNLDYPSKKAVFLVKSL